MILAGAVLGLAGPGKKISGIMPCTVIAPGDMADRILNRDTHPEWNGERTKLVYAFPTDKELWERYSHIRAEAFRMYGHAEEATDFYREHRQAMDLGAVIAWPERFNYDELSAIQHAVNLRLQNEAAFFAEYQNEPLATDLAGALTLTVEEIAGKINRHARATVPLAASRVTMFVDVQGALLYYLVAAWTDDFSGFILDYGTWPDQKRDYFMLRDARPTLAQATGTTSPEAAIYAGLERLSAAVLPHEWRREDGANLRIERCLVDAGFMSDTVYQFCRQTSFAGIVSPSHGRFVGASSVPWEEYRRKTGDRLGHYWRMPNVQGRRAVRYVLFDTNFWKTFVHARLAVPMGERGCLSLYGDRPERHRLLAEHCTAEYFVQTEAKMRPGRVIDEWKWKPERQDNHWFDCLVGAAVAAAMGGSMLPSGDQPAPRGTAGGGAVQLCNPRAVAVATGRFSSLPARKGNP